MKAAALSLAGCRFSSPGEYLACLKKNLQAEKGKVQLVVLPAWLALLAAYRWGELGNPGTLAESLSAFLLLPGSWHEDFRQLHASLAADFSVYLVAGTDFLPGERGISHVACLFSPRGELAGYQEQLYLSRQERQWGLIRGDDARVFPTELGKVAMMVGTDAWYPEVGRILALKGAEIVCHCGAMEAAGENRWRQLAGMWQQVQQNQFFCVESQLVGRIAGTEFSAESLVHAPCEMTENYTGILSRGGTDGKPVAAVLANGLRKQVIAGYPLMELLNPAAYGELYGGRRENEF